MLQIGNRVKLTRPGISVKRGDAGIVVGDCGGTDKVDGYIRVEDNARYEIKFDKDDVNTCDGVYPFLFSESELELLTT